MHRSIHVITAIRIGLLFVLSLMNLNAASVESVRPVRIAVAGDSTACFYADNRPDRGWGMFLEGAFPPGVVEVCNFARAGRSTKTFLQEGLWRQLLASNPDYILIQFGHNDSHAPENPESTDAATDYRDYLRRYIREARDINAKVVLVTPMVRRQFGTDGKLVDNLKPYAEAMKLVGAELKVPVIDLHSASWRLVEELGPEQSARMANRRGDATHFNERGARAMLALILGELPAAAPELAKKLLEAHP